jgi:hypothetical protein
VQIRIVLRCGFRGREVDGGPGGQERSSMVGLFADDFVVGPGWQPPRTVLCATES